MAVLEPIILGIIQGLTEWLPVSSQGHLILAHLLLGFKATVAFDLALHIGSLFVVIIFFRKDILALVKGVFSGNREKLRLLWLLVLGTIPTALIGFFFRDAIEASFSNVEFLGYSFIFSAALLYASRYPLKKTKTMDAWKAFIVGVFQGISIFPAVSRSGSTISSAMIMGVKREEAARYSFLLFIPAIIGAIILQFPALAGAPNIPEMILGVIVSAVVGFLSLKFLLGVIRHGKFHLFAYYCLAIGIVSLLIAYL